MSNAGRAKQASRGFSQLDLRTVLDMARAAYELALARVQLNSQTATRLVGSTPAPEEVAELDLEQDMIAERIAFAIPRVAARVPWRSDCLVQALAAARWLRRRGIPSTLFLGVPKKRGKTFEAHAWLKAGDRVVTGGDITRYVPFAR